MARSLQGDSDGRGVAPAGARAEPHGRPDRAGRGVRAHG